MANISLTELSQRRERTFASMDEGAMLLMAVPEATRNSDVEHPYRQESFLFYLTGFDEPETALLLVKGANGEQRVVAFVRKRNPEAELWTGRRLGVEGALSELGVDEAYSFDEIWSELPRLIKGAPKIYYSLGRDRVRDAEFISMLARERRLRGRHSMYMQTPVYDADMIAAHVRIVKTPDEIARMRKAAEITKQAFDVVYRDVRPGMNERQVHGILIGEFMKGGAEMEAYTSIVAGGANACCLHYHANNQDLQDGTLLLIDAGAQYQYYAADVTRTFPVGRKFTVAQRALYEVVLSVQIAGIGMSVVGKTMQEIHESTCRLITEGLVDIGLLNGSIDMLVEERAFFKYFPHGTGHWLGMDVHDTGHYALNNKPNALQAGMVFTVEPGLYVPVNDFSAPEEFRGVGIRIEDDVLVTQGAPEVLTAGIPKSVHELEDRY